MYISKIHIQNYRNFGDFTMEFHKGLNVIIGANNSGKTGLLHAIKVIVSVTPNRFDKIQITDIYSNPKLTNESPADEFTRMYYVACSRAKEDLFIHLPDISIVDKLHESLHTFAEMTGRGIEYEIIQ